MFYSKFGKVNTSKSQVSFFWDMFGDESHLVQCIHIVVVQGYCAFRFQVTVSLPHIIMADRGSKLVFYVNGTKVNITFLWIVTLKLMGSMVGASLAYILVYFICPEDEHLTVFACNFLKASGTHPHGYALL